MPDLSKPQLARAHHRLSVLTLTALFAVIAVTYANPHPDAEHWSAVRFSTLTGVIVILLVLLGHVAYGFAISGGLDDIGDAGLGRACVAGAVAVCVTSALVFVDGFGLLALAYAALAVLALALTGTTIATHRAARRHADAGAAR